jgi:hypothetical protein
MKFKFDKDIMQIHFNEDELKIMNDKKCLELDLKNSKHFINVLSRIVGEFHRKIVEKDPSLENLLTYDDTEIKSK